MSVYEKKTGETRVWMRRRPIAFAVAASLALLVNAACHFDVAISIVDFDYVPPAQTVELHTDVEWTNNGAVDHTVTSQRSGGFFDSGPIAPSGTFTHTFAWAGTFPYHCEIHPEMNGTIAAKMIAVPPAGTRQDDYTITWALGSGSGPGEIPDGFNMDVQINPPGRAKGWSGWRMNQTDFETMDDFSPSRKGEWKFRARLQRRDRWASDWSPIAVIDVN